MNEFFQRKNSEVEKMSNQKVNSQTDAPSFEDALSQLSKVVGQLEEGNLTLDESLARYEEGIRHLSQCQEMLAAAERKIELLSGFDADGNPITQQFVDKELSLEEKANSRSRRRTAGPTVTQGTQPNTDPETPVENTSDDVDSGSTLF